MKTIEFNDVYFTYPNTTIKVLNGISFKVSEGEFLGVMGHTGAGNHHPEVALRYYTPDSGEVLVNGRPITDYTLHSLREAIGFVSQDPFLFYGTMRDNVITTKKQPMPNSKTPSRWPGLGLCPELEDGINTMVATVVPC